jgi:hypothetical protein
LEPYFLRSVLVLEMRIAGPRFGLSVIPPFIRVGKEDLPQVKPVYVADEVNKRGLET